MVFAALFCSSKATNYKCNPKYTTSRLCFFVTCRARRQRLNSRRGVNNVFYGLSAKISSQRLPTKSGMHLILNQTILPVGGSVIRSRFLTLLLSTSTIFQIKNPKTRRLKSVTNTVRM